MEVCVLASGSKGNSIYVAGGGTAVLIDAGLSARELVARMQAAGVAPEALEAVLFTHDHSDHCKGAEVFCRRYPVRLFANQGTSEGIELSCPGFQPHWEIFETATSFTIGGLRVEAFSVPHDAADPVGFLLDDGTSRLCLATDLGQPTPLVRTRLSQCHAAILESNHDYEMLMQSERPWTLKTRIAGRSGHLSNADAAELLCSALPGPLHTLLLAHLSDACNTPALALGTMRRALRAAGRADVRVEVLEQDRPGPRLVF